MGSREKKKLVKELDLITRTLVYLRDKVICKFCGKPAPDGDRCHVVAKGMGGSASWKRWDLLNMIWGHRDCHIKSHAGIAGFEVETKIDPGINKYLTKYRGGQPAKISLAEMVSLLEELKILKMKWRKQNDRI